MMKPFRLKMHLCFEVKMILNHRTISLGQNTWLIEETAFGSSVYMYLLVGTEKAILIATGLVNLPLLDIVSGLTDLPVVVVNTHGHLDHISGNHLFDTVYLHPADEAVFREHCNYLVRKDYITALLAEKGVPMHETQGILQRSEIQNMLQIPQNGSHRLLVEGMVLDLGGRAIQVIETPGHTWGSLCLLDVSRRWLFSGDTVCDQGVLLHFPHSAPLSVFQDSLRKLISQSGAYDAIFPAHHRYPLEKDIMSSYLACAERIENGEEGLLVQSAVGTARLMQHEAIGITYPALD